MEHLLKRKYSARRGSYLPSTHYRGSEVRLITGRKFVVPVRQFISPHKLRTEARCIKPLSCDEWGIFTRDYSSERHNEWTMRFLIYESYFSELEGAQMPLGTVYVCSRVLMQGREHLFSRSNAR